MFVTRGSPEPDTLQTSVLLTVMEKQMVVMVKMVEKMVVMMEKMIVTQGVERRLGREGGKGGLGGHGEEGLCD